MRMLDVEKNLCDLDTVPPCLVLLVPCLVLLVDHEIPASIFFLQGAIKEVFDVSLSIDRNDSDRGCTEFITGKFPMFIYQRKSGRLMHLKFIPDSYFNKKCAQLVSGHAHYVRARMQSRKLKRAVDRHVMWVKASVMNWDSKIPKSEAYEEIGRALSAFSDYNGTKAIVWPNRSDIKLWDDDMQELLEGGRPLDIFSEHP